jgi:hydroxypyruvate isomerase
MPRFAANLTMLFNEVEFIDRFALASAAGFRGVEYLFPYDYPKEVLVEQLKRHQLAQVLHNLPAGNWAAGERGIACHPDRVDEFRRGVATAIDYAQALGCRQVNCLAGIAPASVAPADLRATFVSNLRHAATQLEQAGIRLLVEPINTLDMPGFYLHHTRQAMEILDEVGHANVWLQYDVYHAQRMEGELANTLTRHRSRIAHIQVADNPGRHEPGAGEINFPWLFAHLDQLGYDGWIGCEYRPRTTTQAGLAWMNRS